jgi:hypothetical protein
MLISALIVRKKPELNKPTFSVAEWSWATVTAFRCSSLYLFYVGGSAW